MTETEAQKTDYKDPTTGAKLQQQREASYFFRMSRWQQALLQHIKANPHFIQPELRRNEILARLEEPLQDLSISRTTFAWGRLLYTQWRSPHSPFAFSSFFIFSLAHSNTSPNW